MTTLIQNKFNHFLWSNGLLGRPQSLRILTYHGIVESYKDSFLERNFVTYHTFVQQVNYLQKHFNVISIDEMLEHKREFKKEVVITFDDGYFNNLIAAEILDKKKIPYSIFLTTSCLGSENESIWPVNLSLLLLKGCLTEIILFEQNWKLDSLENRIRSFNLIRSKLKEEPTPIKQQHMEFLITQFPIGELDRLMYVYPSFKMLSEKQAKNLLSSAYCILGSHGYNHELLHPKQDFESIYYEINKSVQQFNNLFGHYPKYYAFPNGDSCQTAEKILQELDFKASFLNTPLILTELSDVFRIPRLNAPRNLDSFKSKINSYKY